VVMVSGSGSADQNETVGPNHPLLDIAPGLAAGGIAMGSTCPLRSPTKKPRITGAFLRAAEGARTLDLLHGKRYRIGREMAQKPWKSATGGANAPGAKLC
jgi:hypothetical protein